MLRISKVYTGTVSDILFNTPVAPSIRVRQPRVQRHPVPEKQTRLPIPDVDFPGNRFKARSPLLPYEVLQFGPLREAAGSVFSRQRRIVYSSVDGQSA